VEGKLLEIPGPTTAFREVPGKKDILAVPTGRWRWCAPKKQPTAEQPIIGLPMKKLPQTTVSSSGQSAPISGIQLHHQNHMRILFHIAHFALGCITAFSEPTDSYYQGPPLFSQRPTGTQTVEVIERFGPVGMKLHLVQPMFTMEIAEIEEGSPADQTGKFEVGQIIESINGEKLADIDPRIQLGNMITKAEAKDGILKFAIQGEVDPVVVKLPALGAYSAAWPVNCPKSDQIINNFANYISQPDALQAIENSRSRAFGMGPLFLLSTGDDKYLPVVKQWAVNYPDTNHPWQIGYAGLALCEYYLRTGDKEVLEIIQRWVATAERTQVNDSWVGRGGVTKNIHYGGGHLNAAATGMLTFLLLAKECGADVPDHTLQPALRHFYRYSGRGGNPYGDAVPEAGYADNGKNGLLAFAMAAAAALDPDGEDSIYAAARDYSAIESFYSTPFMLHGHTGGGIGEIWRSAAMGLVHEKFPKQYRDFMDSRRWHYELSRRWDGSFAILGGGSRYDNVNWGAGYPLAYTMPRKALRLNGAPPTPHSNPYKLPERPWGNAADEEFVTTEPVPFPDGTVQDLSGETLENDGALQHFRRLHSGTPVSDEELWKHLHHRNYVYRHITAMTLLGVYSNHIGKSMGSGDVRMELFRKALASDQARVRRSILHGLERVLRGASPEETEQLLTKDVFDTIVAFVGNPDESWYVKHGAMNVMCYAPQTWLEPHVDLLLSFLDHEEHWLQRAALDALAPIAGQPSTYRKIIPAVAELIRTNQRPFVTVGMHSRMRERIITAAPEVQELAVKELGKSYAGFEPTTPEPGGQDITILINNHLRFIAESVAEMPGGHDLLYQIARQRYPNEILPHKEVFLQADPELLSNELRENIKPIIRDELIPAYVGQNRADLDKLARQVSQSQFPGDDEINALAMLHDRAGNDSYHWQMFSNLRQAEWSYLSFDPIAEEQVAYDRLNVRYREVTMPENTINWQQPSFDPTAAGWNVGKSPFANYLGELPTQPFSKCGPKCVGPGCYGAIQPNTLWEKEVLLLRGTFDIPELKPGHRYRIRVNMGEHVGNGCGYGIWVNGKQLTEITRSIPSGKADTPMGAFITAPFFKEFQGQPVTIAVKTFHRYADIRKGLPKTKELQGRISLHLEEQEIPPITDDLVRQSATSVGMRGEAWLEAFIEDNADVDPDDFLFRWDGKFVGNDNLSGTWKLLGETSDLEATDPSQNLASVRNPDFKTITFKDGGDTNLATRLWSGDMLMNLDQYCAQRILTKSIGGNEYLLIQSPENFNRPNKNQQLEIKWLVLGR